MLPPFRGCVPNRESIQRLNEPAGRRHGTDKLIVADSAPTLDHLTQCVGPSIRTSFREETIIARQEPIHIGVPSKAAIHTPDDLGMSFGRKREHAFKGRNCWDQAIAAMLKTRIQLR